MEVRYAGFNIRSGAYTIDGFIILALTYLIYYAMGGDANAQDLTDMVQQLQANAQQNDAMGAMDMMDKIFGGGPSLELATAVSAAYNIGFGVSHWQGTPGKHWRGLKIIRAATGERMDLLTSTIRHVATGLSTILCFVGFMMAGWTKEKTALHDLIAGTRVIYRE